MRTFWTTPGLLVMLAMVPWSAAGEEAAPESAVVWQRWEHTLTSDRDYANPVTDVQVRVRFEGPGGQIRTALAFWDGERRFVLRHAFPSERRWRWSTTCSDPSNAGLHNRSGVVLVRPYRGTNPLYRRGHLRVSDDGRLLVHADGTPFLWVGDTCWAAPAHATEAEWRRYVADRVARGYSVLQIAVVADWALERSRLGVMPFHSTIRDINRPNPLYFRNLDRLLGHANDSGLVVLMVGLMEPYRYPPPDQVAVFSRYVAARYGAFAVIFSPSFDSGIREAETLASARAIRDAAPHSLITMHMGTGVGPRFHGEDWLSFDMYQSGHNGGSTRLQSLRATAMPAEILALKPRKPIVNGEAIYEGDLGGTYDVRRTAWLSFLSGAVGYTAGINEVYEWAPDVMIRMTAASTHHVSLLGRVLRALPWWRLEATPQRIANQPPDQPKLMAMAMTDDRRMALAYLPDNEALEAELTGCLTRYDLLWISPITGQCLPGGSLAAVHRTRLVRPDRRDWVALLTAPGSTAPAAVKKALADLPQRRGDAASIAFGPMASFDGLTLKTPRDGMVVAATYAGVPCVLNENPSRNRYLYLDLDDRIAFRGGVARLHVEVRLSSDGPTDGVRLQYDAEGPEQTSTIYREVAASAVRREGDWTAITFVADRPYLGNRQNAGSDFRIFLGDRLCRIALVRVRLSR